jgi:hypothetical protein
VLAGLQDKELTLAGPETVITAARIDTAGGLIAATIDLVEVGGGSQTVTVDGTPEERIHPHSTVFHVRLLSPDRMIPDELRQVPTFDEAVSLGTAYAARLDEHAQRIAELAEDLKV